MWYFHGGIIKINTVEEKYILSIDQGTTSSRAIIFSPSGKIISKKQEEYTQFYPQKGWVEHDANEIFDTQLKVMRSVLKETGISPEQIAGIGITNQRETTVVWDKTTGEPIHKAIVWQDKRTAEFCKRLINEDYESLIRQKTGLPIDSYFSATKIWWILDNVPNALERAKNGELLFGTIDTWLIWKLTDGQVHATDPSNASRTLLFNINTSEWDNTLLDIFGIPGDMLPEVKDSNDHFGYIGKELLGANIPIEAVLGDQQAALFGQQCWQKGTAKNTYGTGCFLLMNTGSNPVLSENGLITTIAWRIDGQMTYALEGSVFIGGAAIQWLRDGLQVINDASETEALAKSVEDSNGVYVVPAFTGLGAPYWDMEAKGAILGLTRDTTKAHIVRATLEGIAFQSKDLLDAMEQDAQVNLRRLKVDGGATANAYLMQFQANILSAEVEVAAVSESTALGVALLASISLGLITDKELIARLSKGTKYTHKMPPEEVKKRCEGWKEAVRRVLS